MIFFHWDKICLLHREGVNSTKLCTHGVCDTQTIKSFDKFYMAFPRFNYPIKPWEHRTADSYMTLSLE